MADKRNVFKYFVIRGSNYEDIPDDELTSVAILEGLRETSTSHGFPQISHAKGPAKKTVWLIILLGMVGALIFNLEQITSTFFKYDVETAVFIHNVNKQQFPAVTLCNMSPFKASLVKDNEQLASILGINENKLRGKRDIQEIAALDESVKSAAIEQEMPLAYRQKRYVAAPTCNANNFHPATGICFALATKTFTAGGNIVKVVGTDPQAIQRQNCQSTAFDLAVINTADKWNFIKSKNVIFTPGATDSTNLTHYWIRLKYINGVWRWGTQSTDQALSFSAWDTAGGFPRNPTSNQCVYADSNFGHLWRNGDCWAYKMALCEFNTGLIPTYPEVEIASTFPPTSTESHTTQAILTTQPATTQAFTTTVEPTTENAEKSATLEVTTVEETTSSIQTTEAPVHAPSTEDKTTEKSTTEQHTTSLEDTSIKETTEAQTTTKSNIVTTLSPYVSTKDAISTVNSEQSTEKTTAPYVKSSTATPEITTEIEHSTAHNVDLTTTSTHMHTTSRLYIGTTTGNIEIDTTNSDTATKLFNNERSTHDKTSTPYAITSESDHFSTHEFDASTTESRVVTPIGIPVITTHVPPPEPERRPVPGSQFPERELQEDEFIHETSTLESLSNIDEEIKKSVGYEPEKFIIDCQFAGYPCYHWQFSYFYNGIHGNCYIFNSGWNESEPIRWSYNVGRRYALKVVLNIDQDEYIEQIGQEAGVRVVIHNQERMPFPEDEGVMAKPGKLTSIAINKVSIERKGRPYTKCYPVDESHIMLNVYEERYKVKYSNLACYKTCYQRNVIEQCKCADSGFPMTGKAFGNAPTHICNTSNIIEDDCLYNVSQYYAANRLPCDCLDPCSDEYFIHAISHSRWPADNSLQEFLETHSALIPNIVNSSDPKKYEDDLAKLEVYFETFQYEQIQEVASYKQLVFIGDIGGTFGLWVGWSFITVFEFLEMFVDLGVQSCRRRSSVKDKRKSSARNRLQVVPTSRSSRTRSSRNGDDSKSDIDMTTFSVSRDCGSSSVSSTETTRTMESHLSARDAFSGRSRTTVSRHGTHLVFK